MSDDLRSALTEQLATVTPPVGDLARAKHEGTRLRRRRRVAVGVGTAVAVLVVAGGVTAAVQLTVGDGRDAVTPSDDVPDGLVLTPAKGPSVELPAPAAGCTESETEPGTQVLYVFVGRSDGKGPTFYLTVPEDELDLPLTIDLPWDGPVDGDPSEEHAVFAESPGNEASGSEGGSSGSVEVLAAGCEMGAEIRIGVDVRLGSEFGEGPIDVAGGITTEVIDLGAYFASPPLDFHESD